MEKKKLKPRRWVIVTLTVVRDMIVITVLLVIMFWTLIHAVLQESERITPLRDYEIAEINGCE